VSSQNTNFFARIPEEILNKVSECKQSTSDKRVSGPVFVFKMSFDKPSIYISKGRKNEIGNYTCMKAKAISDKSFC